MLSLAKQEVRNVGGNELVATGAVVVERVAAGPLGGRRGAAVLAGEVPWFPAATAPFQTHACPRFEPIDVTPSAAVPYSPNSPANPARTPPAFTSSAAV